MFMSAALIFYKAKACSNPSAYKSGVSIVAG